MTADPLAGPGRDPYPGPRPYRSDESRSFFGRDNEAGTVAALWLGKRLTVLSGGPGVGKTSLVQAGVMHLVIRRGIDVLPIGNLTSRSPFSAVPLLEHNPFVLALLSSWAPSEDPVRLSTMTVSGFIRQRVRTTGVGTVLAAVDHAEDLFRHPIGAERHRDVFINELTGVLRDHPDLHILLVIRDSQLAELSSDARLSADAQVMLRRLGRKAAVDAVQRPVARMGRSFAPEAAEELVGALLAAPPGDAADGPEAEDDGGVHPAVLQLAAARLWDALPPGTMTITKADLLRLADLDRWLAEFICHAVSAVSRFRELDPRQLSRWLTRTFITTAGTRATVSERHGSVAGMPAPVLVAAEGYHVLQSGLRSGSRWWELESGRLIGPLQLAAEMIAEFLRTAVPPGLADWLADAESAFVGGELKLAKRHAQRAVSFSSPADILGLARAETLLGNIAYQSRDTKQALAHYLSASRFFEVAQNRVAVGRLLAAVGRLQLMNQDITAAVATLQAAVSRLPTDSSARAELALAFAAAGAGHAAAAVISSVPDSGISDNIDEADEMGRGNGPMLLRAAQIRALQGDLTSAAHLAGKAVGATEIPLTEFQRRQAKRLQRERGA